MISVDNCFFSKDVMLALVVGLDNGVHFLVIGGVLVDCIRKCLTVICHGMVMLSEDRTNSVVRSICLDLKGLL